MNAYITSVGAFLPGEPIGNDELESYLGTIAGRSDRLRRRMLDANGIEKRHYAIDRNGQTLMLNEELAERAVLAALQGRGMSSRDIGMLATGTTQGDLAVPGFASMVHGRLGGGPMEILSAAGVCCSGVAALRAAEAAILLDRHQVAVAVGSELVSRTLRSDRFSKEEPPGFDAEFLRWMLSDGAGAVVVEPQPRADGVSLRIDWSHLVSHAHRFPVCMYAGATAPDQIEPGSTWQDQASPAEAHAAGMLNLRQDTATLNGIVALGVEEYIGLARDGRIDPDEIDHLLVHYSSEYFRSDIVRMMSEAGLMIPEERWFTNLRTKGNTGAASIFIMLEEAFNAGRFSPGDRILLMVPESGRFSVSFVHLTCVAGSNQPETAKENEVAISVETTDQAAESEQSPEWLFEELAMVWAGFETQLSTVPIVRRIEQREASLDDYRALLYNLRQQVLEGARWITRAASNLTVDYTDLRAEFIEHAAEEQRDFRMLENDYVAVGGSRQAIQSGQKNPGSEALSAFMFNQANRENPFDLLGAMYIIEGLGANKASHWVELIKDQLDLSSEQVSFIEYHGGADEEHTEKMFQILRSDLITPEIARSIVHTARVVARLYALQLEEIENA
ncbi:MAG TPA: iron-containing redox enzyme family protein [Acidimicrobiia bacterium]|nr:iron-containing redox enzyme family protein [Acidimicrobiia bacterium]